MWTKLPPSCSCQKNGWLLVIETERHTSRDLDRAQGVQDQCACLWPKLSQLPVPALLEPRDLTGIPSGPTPSATCCHLLGNWATFAGLGIDDATQGIDDATQGSCSSGQPRANPGPTQRGP